MEEPGRDDPALSAADVPPATADAEPPPPVAATRSGGGLRLLAALVLAPWFLGYGITGSWAVTRGARALADGLSSLDVGYTGMVTPRGVILVGALLLAAFATLIAVGLLLLVGSTGARRWAAAGVVATLLTGGSVWAAVKGGLGVGLWFLFFFGLLYAAVLSFVCLWRVTRAPHRGRIARP
jgi:hypothetical protein